MFAASVAQAQALVRDPSHFQWSILPFMLLVLHAYHEQAAEKRWSVVLGGLAFWLMDWINEIANGLLMHFSGFAPAWGVPGVSTFVILIGLNIEISLMFAILGLLAVRLLPENPRLRVFGINNRWLFAGVNAVLCIAVECALNRMGMLTWEWRFWNFNAPWLIFLLGYLPFFRVAYWVHDLPLARARVVVCGQAIVVISGLVLFIGVLRWI